MILHAELTKEVYMFKKGFTLAEVLITLMIIGIVAALTIPSVISNYQQQEFKTGLKKAVSVLNEAIQTNIAIDDETPYDRDFSENSSSLYLTDYLSKHMSVIKKERWLINGESLVDGSSPSVVKNNAFYTTDGMRFETPAGSADLNDNAYLHEDRIHITRANGDHTPCGSYGLLNNSHNTTYAPCFVLVDVNGDKKPTVYGANLVATSDRTSLKKNYLYPSPSDKKLSDIFSIMITDEKAIPFGVVAQRAMYSSK